MKTRTLLLALVGSAPLAGQTQVHVVAPSAGPGVDFTSLQAAVDASPVGTILLVKSGDYAGFTTYGRAVHVVADAGAVARVTSIGVSLSMTPALQSCSLRGFEIDAFDGLTLSSASGSLWVEDCRIHRKVDVAGCASAGVARCKSVASSYPGIRVSEAIGWPCRLWSFENEWHGAAGVAGTAPYLANGRTGLSSSGGEILVAGGLARGGDGAQTTLEGTCVQGFAGQGAYLNNGAIVRHIGATFEGGVPSTGCGLPPGGGEAIVAFNATVEALAGTSRSLVASSPVREGQLATIDVRGAPGEYALVVYGPDFQPGVFSHAWRAPLLVGAPQSFVALGVLPASGAAQLAFTVGELGAGVEGARAVAQGVFVDPATLAVQLGSASELVALDAAF